VLAPLAGTVTEGKGLAIGYFAQQELDLLSPDDTPLTHMARQAPQAREQELRDFLGRFRFGGDAVHQPIGTLSGGEQARLVLATIVWQRPNLLLLDEPTNHLDLDTREALSVALNEFEGTLLLVSHDRALLREVCDEFWLVARGAVQSFDGDLDDYQRWLLEQSRAQAQARSQQVRAPRADTAGDAGSGGNRREQRKAQAAARQRAAEETKHLRAELRQVDQRLAAAAAEREAALAMLARPDLGSAERAEQGRRLKALDDEVQTLETRWLEISEAIEQMSGA
jgi:ATP-binding cassette subfamily F protein 3